MNNNRYTKIFASYIMPNPAMDVLWMDLSEDARGSIIKFWNGSSYLPMALGNAGELGDVLASITAQIAQAKSEAVDESGEYSDSIIATLDISNLMTLNASNSDVDKLEFNIDTESADALTAGQFRWNATDGTIDLGMTDGNVVQSLGLELYCRVRNVSEVDINNGDLVMISGSDQNNGLILARPALPNCDPSMILGVATEDILDGNIGLVTWYGKVKGINSGSWNVGDILYQSNTHEGSLTNVLPSSPANKGAIAIVSIAHSLNGVIFVRIQRSLSLGSINDVTDTNAVAGQVLSKVLVGADLIWKNKTLTADDIVETEEKRFYTPGDVINLNEFLRNGSIENLIEINDVVSNNKFGSYILLDNGVHYFKIVDTDGAEYTPSSGGIVFEYINEFPYVKASSSNAVAGEFSGPIAGYVSTITAVGTTTYINLGVMTTYNDAKVIENAVVLLRSDVNTAQLDLLEKIDDAFVDDDGLLYLTADGVIKAGPFAVSGGGGGGGASKMSLTSITPTSFPIASGEPVVISFICTSVDSETLEPTGDLNVKLTINNSTIVELTKAQGTINIDVSSYMAPGTNTVKATVTDMYNSIRAISYSIQIVNISISSIFNYAIPVTGQISYKYRPIGAFEKVIHFMVDDVEIHTATTSLSNIEITQILPAQTHGSHRLEVYATADISGLIVESNHLVYDIISLVSGNNTPIITTQFNIEEVGQYETVRIGYIVYTPNTETSSLSIEENGTEISSLIDIPRTEQSFDYRADTFGLVSITFISGTTERSVAFNVAESIIKFEAETDGLELFLTSTGRSNSEIDRDVWEYTSEGAVTTTAVMTDFDWVGNGWLKDDNNNTVLRMNGDASVYIPFNIFATDFKTDGKTIEIDFSTKDITDFSQNIISCMSGNVGLNITPQKTIFKSTFKELNSYFKDEERVRIAFVVTKSAETHLIFTYLNGIMSGIAQYTIGDNPDYFNQISPVGITITGSNLNSVDIYNIRVYNKDLSTSQILSNFISDFDNIEDKLSYYYRNDILDEYGRIPYEYLIDPDNEYNIPVLILTGELPPAKGSKRYLDLEYIDPLVPTNNFYMVANRTPGEENADVQGTSSAVYPKKNYKLKFKKGQFYQNGLLVSGGKYKLRPDSIAVNVFTIKADFAESSGTHNTGMAVLAHEILTSMGYYTPPQLLNPVIRSTVDGFPIACFHRATPEDTPYFLGKYNFNTDKDATDAYGFDEDNPANQSWEFTNNASLLCLFKDNDFDTIIEWVDEGTGVPMVGPAWKAAFEARFPEDSEDTTEFKKLYDWFMPLITTVVPISFYSPLSSLTLSEDISREYLILDPLDVDNFGHKASFNGTSNEWEDAGVYDPFESPITINGTVFDYDTEEYRVAKFASEAEEHFNLDYLCAYYLLTELFGMTDQRAKNMFLATWGPEDGFGAESIWYPTLYDNDTLAGIRNTGEIKFDYTIETDTFVDGQYAYNGYSSELWISVEKALSSRLGSTYANMRQVLSYDVAYDSFMTNQSDKWSETIYNEDAEFKYIDSLLSGAGNYLANAQGSRADHRKWWLYNRFKYLDSKYGLADFLTTDITMRINTPDPKRYILSVEDFDGDISYDYRVIIGSAEYNIIEHSIDGGTGNTIMAIKLVSGSGVVPSTGTLSYTQNLSLVYNCTVTETILNDLVVTPSNDFALSILKPGYIRIKYSNLQTSSARLSPGVVTTIIGPTNALNDLETSIYGADNLKTLDDLSNKYIGFLRFNNATRLRSLIIGNGTPGYVNLALGSSDDVEIGALTLLQKLDIQNCPNVRNSIDLSGCVSLEEVNLLGTNVPSVSLAQGARIEKLYLPSVISLVMIGLTKLTEANFQIGTDKLQRLRIENTNGIDLYTLVDDAITNSPGFTYVRLIDVDMAGETDEMLFELTKDDYYGIDYLGNNIPTPGSAVVTGTYHADMATSIYIDTINNKFGELVFTYDDIRIVFEDSAVSAIVLANWDTELKGYVSVHDVEGILDIGSVFSGNTTIAKFNELENFTGITTIPSSSFMGTTDLTEIKIPANVTSIGSMAFLNSSISGQLTLPSGLLSIGDEFNIGAFENCTNLTGTLTIPSTVTYIANRAFKACSGFTGSLTIPNSVTQLSDAVVTNAGVFEGCSGFNGTLTIGTGISILRSRMFYGCSSLTGMVNIPANITSILNSVFYNCSSVSSFKLNSLTPPTLGTTVFTNTGTGKIYIPAGSLAAYQSATNWSALSARFEEY